MTGKQRRVDIIAQAFADRIFRELHAHTKVHAGFWLEAVVSEMFPGESVELYAPKIASTARAERDAKVMQALNGGASPLEASKQLGVPETTVRRVHKRRRIDSGRQFPP